MEALEDNGEDSKNKKSVILVASGTSASSEHIVSTEDSKDIRDVEYIEFNVFWYNCDLHKSDKYFTFCILTDVIDTDDGAEDVDDVLIKDVSGSSQINSSCSIVVWISWTGCWRYWAFLVLSVFLMITFISVIRHLVVLSWFLTSLIYSDLLILSDIWMNIFISLL